LRYPTKIRVDKFFRVEKNVDEECRGFDAPSTAVIKRTLYARGL
jgi:hypothetical protein